MGPSLDPALSALKIQAAALEAGVSSRTIRRWLKAYEEDGFTGLLPASRPSNRTGSVTEAILDEAVMLGREAPNRSVHDIIRILELEGTVAKGELKRSTLQDHLSRRGYASLQLKAFQRVPRGPSQPSAGSSLNIAMTCGRRISSTSWSCLKPHPTKSHSALRGGVHR